MKPVAILALVAVLINAQTGNVGLSLNLNQNFFNQMKSKHFEQLFSYFQNLPLPNQSGSQNGMTYSTSNTTFNIVNNDQRNLNISLQSGANQVQITLTNSKIDLFTFYTFVNGSTTTKGSVEA